MADSQGLEQDGALDVSGMADRVGAAVFGEASSSPGSDPPLPEGTSDVAAPVVSPLETPKSWRKDMHEYWPKMDRKVQEYYIEREKQMLDGLEGYKRGAEYAKPFMDTLQPYSHLFTERKPHEMVGSLLRAHQLLTQGSEADRRKAYEDLGRNLNLLTAQMDSSGAQQQVDPLAQLSQKLSTIEQTIQAQQEVAMKTARAEAEKSVEQFAADTTAHPYFDEVAEDMMKFLRQGSSLQEAYDAAVSFNAAVREKERTRLLTEHEAKLKENARLASLPKKKAVSVNVRGSDTGRTPTEPVGSLEDTIKSKLREIRARAS